MRGQGEAGGAYVSAVGQSKLASAVAAVNIAPARRGRRRSGGAAMEALDTRRLFAGSVFATVLHDANGNGVKDPEEPPLQGWTVFVDYNRDGLKSAGEPSGVTNIDGETTITNVTQGTWDIVEVLQPGWGPAPGQSATIRDRVRNGETLDLVWLNVPGSAGGVEGTVWHDVTGNGTREPTDPGLAGWTVFADLNLNHVLDATEPSAVTDASGFYVIPSLPIGDVKIREITPGSWNPTIGFDNEVTVTVAPGTNQVVDFGNFSPLGVGTINGTVWNDVNADGIRAAGDPGLAGWTVFVDLNNNGLQDATDLITTSDPSGVFSFPSLAGSSYTVRTVLQPGWNLSPGHPDVLNVNVVGGTITTIQFAAFTPTPGGVSGKLWNDANGDGFVSAGEAPLSGWTVFIDADGDGALGATEQSRVTDAAGTYLFDNVPVGAISVREIPQVGWTPTAPATAVQLANVLNGSVTGNVNFGNKQRTDGEIRGVAFADTNLNGVRNAGEKGLPGLTVFLDLNDDGNLDPGEPSTVTSNDLFYTPAVDEAGTYAFTHLPAGNFKVREIVPAVLSATLESTRARLVSLAVGEVRNNVDFANRYRNNEIRGHKYNDVNGNRQRDPGEPGIGGVTVYVDLDRDGVLDAGEPKTVTAADGSYAFTTELSPRSYVVREVMPWGWTQTYPATTGGILWPSGTSNAAAGNVTPGSITASLAEGQTLSQSVSLTLPGGGSITNKVDVFLLFDDTGSFTGNSPIVRAAFPQIIASLQAALPGVDLAFGVGRFEEYANFASEFSTGRPFILNQPIISAATPGFSTAIQSALDRTTPGYGGDQPETDIEALYQAATGRGFDGNNNGNTTDSGPAGAVSTQLNPGASGDVPAFNSFTIDPAGNVLPAAGNVGGVGFRAGALPIILTATDTGFAFQPKGETSVTGLGGVTLPISAFTQTSRPTTPFASGAGIQETVTALNALGALVIGLGTNPQATLDPRQGLEALATMTGAVNRSAVTIDNGTTDPIAPGDPLYFQISSGFAASVSNGVTTAIQNGVTNVAVDIALKSSDPRVLLSYDPGVIRNVAAGGTANFNVTFTGDGRPHRFDLQFVRAGTDVVLGSIPVVLGTPINGDGYDYEDLDDGQIDDTVDFGNQIDPTATLGVTPHFDHEVRQAVVLDFDHDVLAGFDPTAFSVIDTATGAAVPLAGVQYDAAAQQATVTFAPGVLADGHYKLTVAAGAATGMHAAMQFDFTVLAGDANNDGAVDAADRDVAIAHFGQTGQTFSQGNFDYDPQGKVDLNDLAIVARHFTAGPVAIVAPGTAAAGTAALGGGFQIALPGVPGGLDLSAFTVSRNGGPSVSLAGTGATLSSPAAASIGLDGLAGVTGPVGFYRFRLNPGAWTTDGGAVTSPVEFTYFHYKVGDLNADGVVNNLDIAPFVQALTNTAGFVAANGYDPTLPGDINGDGFLNNLDIAAFVSLLTAAPAPSVAPSAPPRPGVRAPRSAVSLASSDGRLFSSQPLSPRTDVLS
jgi:hypothetical protein